MLHVVPAAVGLGPVLCALQFLDQLEWVLCVAWVLKLVYGGSWILYMRPAWHTPCTVHGSNTDPGAAPGTGGWDSKGWIQPAGCIVDTPDLHLLRPFLPTTTNYGHEIICKKTSTPWTEGSISKSPPVKIQMLIPNTDLSRYILKRVKVRPLHLWS